MPGRKPTLPIPLKEMTPEQFKAHRNEIQRRFRASKPTKKYKTSEDYKIRRRKEYAKKRIESGGIYNPHGKYTRIKGVLTPEQAKARENERQRIAYRKRMDAKGIKPKQPAMPAEELRALKREWYKRRREREGKEYIPQEVRSEMSKKKKAVKAIKEPKPIKPVKVKPSKPVKVTVLKVAKIRKKVKREVEKVKEPVLPTLTRDESEFVSVKIDSKTSLWVHRDRAMEAKANYVAKMLQGGIVK